MGILPRLWRLVEFMGGHCNMRRIVGWLSAVALVLLWVLAASVCNIPYC